MEEAAYAREDEVKNFFQDSSVDDFNFHEKRHKKLGKFHPGKVAKKVAKIERKKPDQRHDWTWSLVGGFFASAVTIGNILLARSFHSEREKLVNLNRILANDNARVAHGKNKERLIKTIDDYKSSSTLGDDEEHAPLTAIQPKFSYSLHESPATTPPRPASPTQAQVYPRLSLTCLPPNSYPVIERRQ